MAWTAPRTWVTSEVVTSSIMNTHVRDNLREAVRLYDRTATALDINNTAAETSAYSVSIAGGILGTDNAVRCTLIADHLNNTGGNTQFTVRVKYGATTMWGDLSQTFAAGATRRSFRMQFELVAGDATNAQYLHGSISAGQAITAGSVAGLGHWDFGNATMLGTFGGTAAEDSTAAKTLDITIQHASATTNLSFRRRYAMVEAMRNI